MCLIAFAWRAHPDHPLIVAANRDEFFARQTAPAAFWGDAPDVLAGRDLAGGGTWLGVTRGGRFAAVTNVRNARQPRVGTKSRGELVARYLMGNDDPAAYLESIRDDGASSRRDDGRPVARQ